MTLCDPEYSNEYKYGYTCGVNGLELSDNPYDFTVDYKKWHSWNGGLFDGYKKYLTQTIKSEDK